MNQFAATPTRPVPDIATRELPWRRVATPLERGCLGVVLCGGRGTRLGALTEWRAKPAVPFGAAFRVVDFTLANCLNSGIRRVAVLTQYKAQSLIRHIQDGWSLPRRFGEFVEIVPAQQRKDDSWYLGTADAVFQNLDLIERHRPQHVLVLCGDHVYKMDYTLLLAEHVANRADLTVACSEVSCEDACGFGVVTADAQGRVTDFQEKPASPRPLPGSRDRALASMGIYVFDAVRLICELTRDATNAQSSHDFGRDIVPAMLGAGAGVFAHSFERSCVRHAGAPAYWRDVGTLEAYWEACMDLTDAQPAFDLFDEAWPIPSEVRSARPTRFIPDALGRRPYVSETLMGSGCTIGAAEVRRSLVSADVRIADGARVEESVLLPDVDVRAGVVLKRVIVDKHCKLPTGLIAGIDTERDRLRFHVTDRGITLITPEMLGQRS
ncbi:MAG: glucose-1-phosphate adenylyltransferase [Burkholderiales bacterium]|nr:glucose-1-phosphate adenylyltransferase [Burkholderiales bacterium]